MTIALIIDLDGTQVVQLPDEFRFSSATVSIRRDGQAVVLKPVMQTAWPVNFFESIRIVDPVFLRPDQGPISKDRLDL